MVGAERPETTQVRLATPREIKPGDTFHVLPPAMNWQIHHNTVADCLRPVVLDGHGSPTSLFRDNILTRETLTGIKQGIELRGRFQLTGNRLFGFDEADCAALSLYPDPTGAAARSHITENVFERCALPVRENGAGLWQAAVTRGNEFIDCGTPPPQAAIPAEPAASVATLPAPAPPVLPAPNAEPAPVVDGAVDEWPWQDQTRVVAIAQTPNGQTSPVAAQACAARNGEFIYLAVRIPVGDKATLQGGTDFPTCDGVEVSLRAAGENPATHVLWGSCNGDWLPLPAGETTTADREAIRQTVRYAARTAATEWTCEWRIPLRETGAGPDGQLPEIGRASCRERV